jgi:hypothetical protein
MRVYALALVYAAPLDVESPSSWCGWHNDHGSLTGLTVAMFQDKDGKEVRQLPSSISFTALLCGGSCELSRSVHDPLAPPPWLCQVPCPDKKAGLYIRSRAGEIVRVALPSDVLAFQIGETAQIHSGGVLQATPHSVQASSAPGVSRSTLAVFMEPEPHYPMTAPVGSEHGRILRGMSGELLPPGVPPLRGRWSEADDFGEFSHKTLSSYY